MWSQVRTRNFWIVLGVDALLAVLAYWGAYLIRFEGRVPNFYYENLVDTLWWVVGIKITCLFFFDDYKGMWRYTSIQDFKKLLQASLSGSALIVSFLVILTRFSGYSRSVFVIDFLIFFVFISGFRLSIRLYYQKRDQRYFLTSAGAAAKNITRIIIIGAGDAGEKTLREIIENRRLHYHVIGFIDDASAKRGRTIHSVPVLGGVDTLAAHVEAHKIDEIIIAAPSATGKQMRRFVDACEISNIPYKTLPGIGEIIDGQVSLKSLRDVSFRDLLGRPAVNLDVEGIAGFLKKKNIMVTGAGGSIGSELCRQIACFHPAVILLFDASEESLYHIEMEFKRNWPRQRVVAVLGGIQNEPLLSRVFRKHRPEVVFHAAAYKHVPLIEQNPWQGVLNNVLGTQCLLKQCIEHQTGQFVLVSTDKAVRPTNVMGASKRMCELLVQAYRGNGTRMMAVRFGNVVGSSGSVIPLFRQQIQQGGPVTVTHPDVTRYFMTIPEAAQLILQAGFFGDDGNIFILEMGTPVKIVDMARDLIRLSGKDPEHDIEIEFTGLRPGEKLYEELITAGEGIVPTRHEKIMVLNGDGDLSGYENREKFKDGVMAGVSALYALARRHDGCGIRDKLQEIIPEYEPQDSECVV